MRDRLYGESDYLLKGKHRLVPEPSTKGHYFEGWFSRTRVQGGSISLLACLLVAFYTIFMCQSEAEVTGCTNIS